MAHDLQDMRVAFLATDGVEQVELTEPWRALEAAGAEPHLIAPEEGEIQGMHHDEKGDVLPVTRTLEEASPEEYLGLVLPGGVANPDRLRLNDRAVAFVRHFFEARKPVGVICHGPWTLVEAEVLRGRTLTSWPSLQTDIRNAGGTWVDQEVHVDDGLVSSRKPDDLPAFCRALVETFAKHHQDRAAQRGSLPAPSPPTLAGWSTEPSARRA